MTVPTGRLLLWAFQAFERALVARLHASGFPDVTASHVNLLRHLDREGMRASDLAHDAGVSKQAVSQQLRTLVDAGLVSIEPDPDDGRAKRVVWSPAGVAVLDGAIEVVRTIEEEYVERLGADRYTQLRECLQLLATVDA